MAECRQEYIGQEPQALDLCTLGVSSSEKSKKFLNIKKIVIQKKRKRGERKERQLSSGDIAQQLSA